jgi:hypothetical protein
MASPLEQKFVDMLIRINPKSAAAAYHLTEAWIEDTKGVRQHFDGGHFFFEPDMQQISDRKEYGLNLYYALFSGPIMQAYDYAQSIASTQSESRLRIRLWIHSEAAELHKINWENMHLPYEQDVLPFALRPSNPFSRYVDITQPHYVPTADRIIRILLAIASPADVSRFGLPILNNEDELTMLCESLRDLLDAGRLRITVLPGHHGLPASFRQTLNEKVWNILPGPTTQEMVISCLSQDEGYHIFHFIGHGRFNRSDSATMLYLEGRSGNAHIVRDTDFALKIASISNKPDLVFMAACDTSRRDPSSGNPYVGFAPTLIKSGVPAVVVMQDRFPIDASQQLAQFFYRYLLDDGVIDQAMSQARLMLQSQGQQSWDVPVLFTRLHNGRIFRRDPIFSVLNRMWDAVTFNPLPSESDYIPLEVVHYPGNSLLTELKLMNRERKPSRDAITSITDLLKTTPDQVDDAVTQTTPIVILSGEAGMGKSVLLRKVGKMAIDESLESHQQRITIPIYLDVQEVSQKINNPAVWEKVLWLSMSEYWPNLDLYKFLSLLSDEKEQQVWLLIDNVDALTQVDRHNLWQTLGQYVHTYPHHKVILAYNTNLTELPLVSDEQRNTLAAFPWGSAMELFVIQPVSPRTVDWFLSQQGQIGIHLFDAIDSRQLYNIAESPWVLNQLLQKAKRGEFPHSLTQVIRDLFDDAIFQVASNQGMRTKAAETLYAVAWDMHIHMHSSLSLDRLFEIMAEVQGKRRYNLEVLFDAYVRNELLSAMGEEFIRFSRPIMQSYCCAQALLHRANNEQLLDDITATMGRRRRFYWWTEPLTFLAGLGYDPTRLIRAILYGMESGAGEQVLLAALIVQECRWQNVDTQVINYLVQSLVYYLNNRREPREWRRIQLAEALGRIRHPDAIPHLVGVANQRVRLSSFGRERQFETSAVRLSAVMSLRKIASAPYIDIAEIDTELAKILVWWDDADTMALGQYLVDADHLPAEMTGTQAIAAFALGDLQTFSSVDILLNLFLYPYSSDETYQHLTTALTLIDPGIVEKNILLPFIDRDSPNPLEERVWLKREQYLGYIIYLAGSIYTTNARIHTFLRECLRNDPDIDRKALAIQSLGWLQDYATKPSIEKIAQGYLGELNLDDSVTLSDKQNLQKHALQALYHLGDMDTLLLFQQRPASWVPEFEQILYWVSEEILWRQEMHER